MAHYGTLVEADAYHAARNNTAWAIADELKTAALTRASSYIDGHYRKMDGCNRASLFGGSKAAGRTQELEWPRVNAYDSDGAAIDPTEVPLEVRNATYEAALREAVTPGSLSPDYIASQQVVREKVGPIDITYADSSKTGWAPTTPVIGVIDGMLAPLLTARFCGPAIFVV